MRNRAPCVSVIIPVYNAETCLPACIEALKAQTQENFEVIFVDDGSADSSLAILRAAELEDNRFRVFAQEHQNAGAARNRGLKEANGKYLSFLDVDDDYEPSLLQMASSLLESTSAEIAVYHFRELAADGAVSCRAGFPDGLAAADGNLFFPQAEPEKALFFGGASVWNKMYRAELIRRDNLRFDEISAYNDLTFVLRANLAAERIVCLDACLYTYRYNRPGSVSVKKGSEYALIREALDSLTLQERERDPDIIPIANAHFLIKTLLMDIGDYHTAQAARFDHWCRQYLRETHFDRKRIAAFYPQLNSMIFAFRVQDIHMIRIMDRLGIISLLRRYIHGRRERK